MDKFQSLVENFMCCCLRENITPGALIEYFLSYATILNFEYYLENNDVKGAEESLRKSLEFWIKKVKKIKKK